jgi:O-antigen/teichoic acid export membrane protein
MLDGVEPPVVGRWAQRLVGGGGAGWGIADQAFSSLTNFALGLVVIRGTDAAGFGAYSLGFGVYLIALNISRAVATLPLTIRYSTAATSGWRGGTAAATGMATALGVAIGAACVAVGIVVPYRPLADAFVGFGVMMPGLLLQDALRFAFFAAGRGRAALVTDVVWACALVPLFALVLAARLPVVGWATLAWGGAATLGALAGVVLARIRPAPGKARAWWREHRDIAPRFVGEVLVSTVAGQLTPYALGIVGGLTTVGILRAGEFLLGPFNVLFQGIQLIAVPQGARIYARRANDLIAFCRLLAVAYAAAAAACGVAVILLPETVGLAIIGPIWTGARGVLVPLSVAFACVGLQAGPDVGLRVLAAAHRSLRVRSIMAIFLLAGEVIGCSISGAAGAAWAQALVMAVGVIWWTWEFHGGFLDRERRVATPAAPSPDPF